MKKYLPFIIAAIALVTVAYVIRLNLDAHKIDDGGHVVDIPTVTQIPHYIRNEEITSSSVKIDLEQTGIESVDAYIKSDVEARVTRFVADAEKEYTAVPADMRSSAKWNTMWKGVIASQVGTMINYRLDGYDYTGGAHGNPIVITYVWDKTNIGKSPLPVDLSAVFKDGSPWLERLSSVSKELLLAGQLASPETTKMIAENPDLAFKSEEVVAGTTADANNFQSFALEHSGIRIIFGAYQVGPYVIGQPEIIIPWDRVKDVVNLDLLGRVHSE